MNEHWYMLTLVGKDRPGIVAKVSTALYEAGCHLGEASMMRLGGNFSIMLMVNYNAELPELEEKINAVAKALQLRIHLDPIEGKLHDHRAPDVRITVHGADRPGIVAQVTTALAAAGLDILDLESDVAGTADKPVYIMQIEGHAAQGIEPLQQVLDGLGDDIEVHLAPIDTMVG
jgi:glycine cleavage system transcriptional repressor